MTHLGHEERFPPTRLSAGCGFRKETIAGMRRNGRDAPIPAIRATALFVPDHLPAAYVCAYYSLLIFVRGQAKR
jgi:hypothetical protein